MAVADPEMRVRPFFDGRLMGLFLASEIHAVCCRLWGELSDASSLLVVR